MTAAADDQVTLEQRLQNEAGVIGWRDLERHFARGAILVLAEELDIVVVGQAIVRDEAASVERWTTEGKLRRATMEDAAQWHATGERFRALVVAPWVLVQPGEARPGEARPEEAHSDGSDAGD